MFNIKIKHFKISFIIIKTDNLHKTDSKQLITTLNIQSHLIRCIAIKDFNIESQTKLCTNFNLKKLTVS